MNYGFVIDNRKCIGCHACTVACKSEHDVPIGVFRTHVKYVEKGKFPDSKRTFTVHRCNHCEDAPCVEICPTQALFTRKDGIVDFDSRRCIGCKSCMQACPYDALYIDPNTKTAAKCNYCTHRIDRGYEPACVVVCPVEAIVSGDLHDPHSAIAKLVATEPVSVRKPEKDTHPNVFYVEGDASSFAPEINRTNENIWGAQTGGVGYFARQDHEADDQSVEDQAGRRVYDVPSKGVLWGWHVPAYITTKAIATGLVLLGVLSLPLAESSQQALPLQRVAMLSLLFICLTGVLLVADLARPDRFIYVLLRPNWSSWLVRGGYLIFVFSLILVVIIVIGQNLRWLWQIAGFSAVTVASYTAFLLGQARGRDLWQSPVIAIHMLIQAIVAGSAAWIFLGIDVYAGVFFLFLSLLVSLVIVIVEAATPHGSRDSRLAMQHMLRGELAPSFYTSVLLGHMVPLIIAASNPNTALLRLAAVMAVLGIYFYESARIKAPQLVELS